MYSLLSVLAANEIWKWMERFGGPGLILLGLADNSVVPLPGSMDVAIILLTAHHRAWWPYYAFMGVLGAVLGGYVTYRLAEKGGEETLEKKVGKQRAEKVYRRFETHGFWTVFMGAVLPPPVPVVPFLMAAGVLQYPRRKFLSALAAGRAVRFFTIAYISHIYGEQIIGWLSNYYKPLLYGLIGLGVLAGIGALIYFKWYRPRIQKKERERGEPVEQFPIPGHPQKKQR
jgi:membrane protein YqaA with SNARE-associated domain